MTNQIILLLFALPVVSGFALWLVMRADRRRHVSPRARSLAQPQRRARRQTHRPFRIEVVESGRIGRPLLITDLAGGRGGGVRAFNRQLGLAIFFLFLAHGRRALSQKLEHAARRGCEC